MVVGGGEEYTWGRWFGEWRGNVCLWDRYHRARMWAKEGVSMIRRRRGKAHSGGLVRVT